MRDIVLTINNSGCNNVTTTTVVSPTSKADDSLKKSVPDIDSFSDFDEDCYKWRDKVINDLSKSGLGKYFSTDDAHSLAKDFLESVFYALRGTPVGGTRLKPFPGYVQ